jgi:hypothetical protein
VKGLGELSSHSMPVRGKAAQQTRIHQAQELKHFHLLTKQ